MREDFLHYLWKFRKFRISDLQTTSGESLTIITPGEYLQLSGPDFFNAQIIIGKQRWAGNIEIHLKSSDWYAHHHESDPAYENVILHVVWEHDVGIFRKNNTEIPVLLISDYTDADLPDKYKHLTDSRLWIPCEKQLASVDLFVVRRWHEKLFFERLLRKSESALQLLSETRNDWEAVLFCMIARSFGLNHNGAAFMKMAHAIPFDVIRKERAEPSNLEALFFGITGLLDGQHEDVYYKFLKSTWGFLKHKYQLCEIQSGLQFFKLRPDNFPTVRLSQLANLFSSRPHLFTDLISAGSVARLYDIFGVGATGYWQVHYHFDKECPKKYRKLSRDFIDLLIINSVVLLKFVYSKGIGLDATEEIISLASAIPAEKNSVVSRFSGCGIAVQSAFESQALLESKNEYCDRCRCLACPVGHELMKRQPDEKFVSLSQNC